MLEAVWEAIAPSEAELEIPRCHKELLDEREQLIRDGKAGFLDWEVAKQEIRQIVS